MCLIITTPFGRQPSVYPYGGAWNILNTMRQFRPAPQMRLVHRTLRDNPDEDRKLFFFLGRAPDLYPEETYRDSRVLLTL